MFKTYKKLFKKIIKFLSKLLVCLKQAIKYIGTFYTSSLPSPRAIYIPSDILVIISSFVTDIPVIANRLLQYLIKLFELT